MVKNNLENLKIGDWIVPLKDSNGHKRIIGKTYQITKINSFTVEIGKQDGDGKIEFDDFTLAYDHEIPNEFKNLNTVNDFSVFN